ncbi:cytochrome P450 4c21 [Diaphorina citri]|uniref:Cytochrome P450 4c21 n=1 Tax=Diaphorina citri TaxID=121845 RepID=A0A3Q0IYC1_DIACI|nr:cytochrome P450 4c21 [Diaphorina citri]
MWLMILLLAPFLLIFLYFFVALIICYKWDTPKRNYVMAKKLPGPKTLPIIGLALDIALLKPHELNDLCSALLAKHKPFSASRSMGSLIKLSPGDTKEILKSTKYISKGLEYFPIIPWLRTGLLTSKGKAQVKTRPIFTVHKTAMGTKLHGQEGEEYIKAVTKACAMVMKRAQDPTLFNDYFFYFSWSGYQTRKCLKTLHQFTENVIKERRAEYRKKKQNLTDLQTDNNESSSVILKKPRREAELESDKVVSEIEDIFGPQECKDIRKEHLKKMEYLEKVLKESLRLYPSVPYISRWLEQDLVLGEYTIPAQSNIGIMSYLMHRSPELYPDPEKFDPERFSKENSAGRHPFAYIPFSAGPRNCIGQRFAMMEEKVILTQLLRKFRFEAVSSPDQVKCIPYVVLRPLNSELMVRITPRRNAE